MANPQILFRQAFSWVVRTLQGPLVSDDPRLEATRLENRKLAIIGEFCVQHYLGDEQRQTEDLDLMIEFDYPVDAIKVALANTDPDHFRLCAYTLYYYSGGQSVQVDLISHQTALPYHHHEVPIASNVNLPAEATRIRNIQAGHLTFLSVQDMIALKVYCCGTRATEKKNKTDAWDAWDAWMLASTLPEDVTWEQWQYDAIQNGLEDVKHFSGKEYDWATALRL